MALAGSTIGCEMELTQVQDLGVALGIGLLIGIERERSKASDGQLPSEAGVRSFALAALCGGVAAQIGPWMLAASCLGLAVLIIVAYSRAAQQDPGITSELALLLVFLLGALANTVSAGLAAALGVLTTLLLAAKPRIHRLSRELISEQEMHDGLLLAAAALVVLPLLPDRSVDPLGVINPARIWLLVVLVMAISALGHVALRLIGARWGMAISGFFAGYVSSTAAVAGFGERVREDPARLRSAVGAVMWANLASLSLFVPLYSAVSTQALAVIAEPMMGAAGVLLVGGLLGLSANGSGSGSQQPPTATQRMFRFSHALGFALLMSALVALSSLLHRWIGPGAAVAGALLAALGELHAAGATLAQLFAGNALDSATLRWSFVGLLLMSALSKSVLSFVAGGRQYGLRVSFGLLVMCSVAIALAWLQ